MLSFVVSLGILLFLLVIFAHYYFSYKLDENSPFDEDEDTYSYEILSKVNKKLVPQQVAISNDRMQTAADHIRCCSGHHHHH